MFLFSEIKTDTDSTSALIGGFSFETETPISSSGGISLKQEVIMRLTTTSKSLDLTPISRFAMEAKST